MPSELCVKPRLEEQKSVPVQFNVYLDAFEFSEGMDADLGYKSLVPT